MNKALLQPAFGGQFLVNESAANDPICQAVMASYLKRLQQEEAHHQAIRNGSIPAPSGQWETWHISDRH
jgi:hypothetical protein